MCRTRMTASNAQWNGRADFFYCQFHIHVAGMLKTQMGSCVTRRYYKHFETGSRDHSHSRNLGSQVNL